MRLICGLLAFFFTQAPAAPAMEAPVYLGGGVFTEVTETTYFSDRQVNAYSFPGEMPKYIDGSNQQNKCANIAAANVLGYYDRYYDDLIPNFTAGRQFGSTYIYFSQTATIQDLINNLAVRMQTNVGREGTTLTNFKNGLTQYVNDRGRTLTLNSFAFNRNAYIQQIQNNIPVIFFCTTFNLISTAGFRVNGGREDILINVFSGSHVFVGYGYKEIRYYDGNNNLMRSDFYVKVASGLTLSTMGYAQIGNKMQIDTCLSAQIN